jgi:protein-S-isoprenylcysteine O-methyltransferase Ste14
MSRLPPLGSRGQGWVVLQGILVIALVIVGLSTAGAWSGLPAILSTIAGLALLMAVLLGVFFDLKSRREEAWLSERFADYAAYAAGTRRLIPWLY